MIKYNDIQQFSYQAELGKIVESKQLVEISFSHEQDMVAYLLRASDEFINYTSLWHKGKRCSSFVQGGQNYIKKPLSRGVLWYQKESGEEYLLI